MKFYDLKDLHLWDQNDPENNFHITLHKQPKFECFESVTLGFASL